MNERRRPSFWREPVEAWQLVQVAVLIVGVIVVYFIDEHLVHWWISCCALASLALWPFVGRKKSG